MSEEKIIISLDISTSTGYAIIKKTENKNVLLEHGLLTPAHGLKCGTPYPYNYLSTAIEMGSTISNLVLEKKKEFDISDVIIEQTNLGRNRGAQRILEWIHAFTVQYIHCYCKGKYLVNIHYVDTSAWRSHLNMRLTKEDKKNNEKVRKAKKQGKRKKDLGLVGVVGWKQLSVRRANSSFGLSLLMKDNDIADALNLGEAWLAGCKTYQE